MHCSSDRLGSKSTCSDEESKRCPADESSKWSDGDPYDGQESQREEEVPVHSVLGNVFLALVRLGSGRLTGYSVPLTMMTLIKPRSRTGDAFFSDLSTAIIELPFEAAEADEREVTSPNENTNDPTPTSI